MRPPEALRTNFLWYAVHRAEAGDSKQAAHLLELIAEYGARGQPLDEPLCWWLKQSATRCLERKGNPVAPGQRGVSIHKWDERQRLQCKVVALMAPIIEAGSSAEKAAQRVADQLGIEPETCIRLRREALADIKNSG